MYQANNKESIQAYNKQYFQANKGTILSRIQAKRALTPKPIKEPKVKPKKKGRYVPDFIAPLFVPEPEPEPSVVYINRPIVVSFH